MKLTTAILSATTFSLAACAFQGPITGASTAVVPTGLVLNADGTTTVTGWDAIRVCQFGLPGSVFVFPVPLVADDGTSVAKATCVSQAEFDKRFKSGGELSSLAPET